MQDEVFDRIINRIDLAIKNLATGQHRFSTQHDLQLALSRIHGMIDALEDGGDFSKEFFHNTRCSATDAYFAGLDLVHRRS